MQTRSSPASLCANDGVLYVRVLARSDGYSIEAGDTSMGAIAESMSSLCDRADGLAEDRPIKAVVGKLTVEIARFEHCDIVVCYESGHKIVKSMQRMLRRCGRAHNSSDFKRPSDFTTES